ncbi:PREDICTED: DNA topoisomerase 6 subunit A3-like [Fragaria vesca subsp. vesca]|uniref:DNA topoisomerase 6 subunit A3-like n=1 Tax=Fragaria vesca subsp. vesca TaxID=101020 RepID=UPI0002C315C9|nr:PREDICTED: DNA topoisomerase 6 subunit A3-like [Fragaria vesca subsp. vesca]
MRKESRSWSIPKVEDEDWEQTIVSFQDLNLESFSRALPERLPAVSNKDLLAKIRVQQRECDEGTLKLVDHRSKNVQFDEDLLCYSLKTTDFICKPQEETVKAYKRALQIVANMLEEGLMNTTRGMFYTAEDVYGSQKRSDFIIRHLASKLEVDRAQLNVFPGDAGSVIGPLSYTLHDVMHVDCNLELHDAVQPKHGVPVPNNMRTISKMEGTSVKFILLVESLAVYSILATANFHNRYRCLLMTGRGMPDVNVREFSRYVSQKLGVALFYLSDCDPNGIEIYTVYKYGSANMAFDSKHLANPNLIWLGVWPSDLSKYEIPSVKMTDNEVHKANQLLKKEFVKRDNRLGEEVRHMVSSKQKTTICVLNCESASGVSEFVLLKLKQVMDEMLILRE